MNYKMLTYMLGRIMLVMAALMCLPFVIAIIKSERAVWGFLLAIVLQLVPGFFLSRKAPENKDIYAKEGLVIVGLTWVLTSLFGALPFYLSREIPSFIDAFFETASGFTTTGSSILNNIEALSKSTLFWRSFTHWIGGMGVLVFMLAILPKSHIRQSMHIMRAEAPGPQVGKLVSRMRSTARILYGIYLALTLIEILLLFLGGMPLFDSVVNSFSTAGTGGFAIKNASIAAYNSAYVDGVISVFMLLFGINFTLFYLILSGSVLQALKSEELHWYLGLVAVATIVITLNILPQYEQLGTAFRYAFFQVSAIITTTGFSTADYTNWPMLSQMILMLLLFIGASAGSTGGGIKVSRVVILVKSAFREIKKQIRPRSVSVIKMEGRPLEEGVATGVLSYMAVYLFIFVVSILLISVNNASFSTSFTAVATCLNNVGPGLDGVGPSQNFAFFSPFSKLVLVFNMLAGRLEHLPVLALFSPSTWKKR